jgi:hypothetical protein
MKLSEQRINSICDQIVDRLVEEKVIKVTGRKSRVRTELERAMIGDLKIEEEIMRESKAFVRRSRNAPPEGSEAFDIQVRRQAEALAAKRNYVL